MPVRPGSPGYNVAVIGAGPAGLMAAEVLARGGARVTVYDRMPSVGRKFLLAGRGGLNLTHSEDARAVSRALRRGDAASARRDRGVSAGCRARLVRGARPGHVRRIERPGVSEIVQDLAAAARVAAAARAARRRLQAAASLDRLGRAWRRSVRHARGPRDVHADAMVLALGGASWPRLGSDGGWVDALAKAGVAMAPLRPANCGFVANWSDVFRERFEGQPLEADRAVVRRTIGARRGDHHPAGARRRRHLRAVRAAARRHRGGGRSGAAHRSASRSAVAELQRRLEAPRRKQSLSTFLRKAANLSPPAIGLLHEAIVAAPGALFRNTPAASPR